MLKDLGYNNGVPITEQFFNEYISGGENRLLAKFLFPDWPAEKSAAWFVEKETRFREMAGEHLR